MNPVPSRYFLALMAACFLLAASLLSCTNEGTDPAAEERLLDLQARAHYLEESLESLTDENAHLQEELDVLRQEQSAFVQKQQAADAARKHQQEVDDFEEVQEQQLADLEERQAQTGERLDDLDTRLQDLDTRISGLEALFTPKQEMSKPSTKPPPESILERTRQLAESTGGEVYNIDSREPEERAILVMPPGPIDGNPLIVSLHGYGGNSAEHSRSFPLHSQVVALGFGLLLPNANPDGEGHPAWNPTDRVGSTGKASADDYRYLKDLVARAKKVKDFGPVYVFGYSNGGFMAYHLACRGLPGLRAVASIAGTSYYDDSECEGAPPVSVLHIHGTADEVILPEGAVAEPRLEADGGFPSYAGAQEMINRWGNRAGCEWPRSPADFAHYAVLDLDMFVRGPETYATRLESGCAEGITIEWWMGAQSGHTPGYLHAFLEALLDWLLSQE